MKILRNFILLIIITGYSAVNSSAQQSLKLLEKLIDINEKYFYSDSFYDKTVVFSISIGINKGGIVDTVVVSNSESSEINQLVYIQKLKKNLLANATAFTGHKNKFLIILVMIARGDENFLAINNGNQYLQDWKSIINMSLNLKTDKREQLFVTPITITSRGKSIKN